MNRFRVLLLLAVVLLLGSGCAQLNASKLPSLGGPKNGYEVTASFDDALNLPIGAAVKLDGATIGQVKAVSAEDFHATVVMSIDRDIKLTDGTTFQLRPTTALGELYVRVTQGQGPGVVEAGHLFGTDATGTAPTVEDGLAAASLLLNGGSLGQLRTIVTEINTALDGRTDTVKHFFTGSDRLLKALNASSNDIDEILTALDQTSTLLANRQKQIDRALRLATPIADVLQRDTTRVLTLVRKMHTASVTISGLVDSVGTDFESVLEQLGPVFETLEGAKSQAKSMLLKATALARQLNEAVPTDYVNLMAVVNATGSQIGLPGLPGVQIPKPAVGSGAEESNR